MTGRSTRVLVTGGAGFVGTWIVKLLARNPKYQIIVTDLKDAEDYTAPEGVPVDSIQYIQADIITPREASQAVEWSRPDVIIHTAGWVPQGQRRYAREPEDVHFIQLVNVEGTRNMLDAARQCGVAAFVHTSSCTVITDDLDNDYPNHDENVPIPQTSMIYGESKARAETLALSANCPTLSTCALRPSVILGPGDYQLIPSIHACIAKSETPFQIGTNNNLYDFTYVENIAHAHILALENLLTTKTAAGQAFFITNQQPVTFRDFCLAVWAAFGHTPRWVVVVPKDAAWMMGTVADWVSWVRGTPFTLSAGSIKDAVGTRYANNTKAQEVLGYRPVVDLWDGIRITCQAYQKQLDEKKVTRFEARTKVFASKQFSGKGHIKEKQNVAVREDMRNSIKDEADVSDEGYATDPARSSSNTMEAVI